MVHDLDFKVEKEDRKLDPNLFKEGDVILFPDQNLPEVVYKVETKKLITILDERKLNLSLIIKSYGYINGAVNFSHVIKETVLNENAIGVEKYIESLNRRQLKNGRI